ncbi:MAG: C2H2-type zinc finger protein [bacterium]
MFICKFCNKEFSKKVYLKNHIDRNHFEEMNYEYICNLCGKGFEEVSGLFKHIKKCHKDVDQKEYWDKHIYGKMKCKFCGDNLHFKRFSGNFCNQQHYETYNRELKGLINYKCELCGVGFETLGGLQIHLFKIHKYDNNDLESYYRKHILKEGDPYGKCLWCGKELKFIGLTDGFQKFCYNQDCNVRWYNENSDRKERAAESTSITYKENPDKCPTKIEYWLAKGYSEEDAKKKLSERQTTFSKDICIEKYGEEEGLKVWQERQNKWLNNFKKQNFSMISQELFWKLYKKISRKYNKIYFATNNNGKNEIDVNREFKFKTKRSYRKFDFFVEDINKVIEFDGTYWHGKVGKGNKDRDKLREMEIMETDPSLEILHIKERDYKDDPEKVIKQCLEFLNG